jgi:hypothetical protein
MLMRSFARLLAFTETAGCQTVLQLCCCCGLLRGCIAAASSSVTLLTLLQHMCPFLLLPVHATPCQAIPSTLLQPASRLPAYRLYSSCCCRTRLPLLLHLAAPVPCSCCSCAAFQQLLSSAVY